MHRAIPQNIYKKVLNDNNSSFFDYPYLFAENEHYKRRMDCIGEFYLCK